MCVTCQVIFAVDERVANTLLSSCSSCSSSPPTSLSLSVCLNVIVHFFWNWMMACVFPNSTCRFCAQSHTRRNITHLWKQVIACLCFFVCFFLFVAWMSCNCHSHMCVCFRECRSFQTRERKRVGSWSLVCYCCIFSEDLGCSCNCLCSSNVKPHPFSFFFVYIKLYVAMICVLSWLVLY